MVLVKYEKKSLFQYKLKIFLFGLKILKEPKTEIMVKEEMHLKIKKLKKNIFHILILSYFVEVGGQMFTKHKKDYL